MHGEVAAQTCPYQGRLLSAPEVCWIWRRPAGRNIPAQFRITLLVSNAPLSAPGWGQLQLTPHLETPTW